MKEQFVVNAATTVGSVTLGVADLPMMSGYYQNIIGLEILDSSATTATLGVSNEAIVRLEKRNGQQHKRNSGLFHLAILLPTRPELGQWLKHYISSLNKMVGGAGDHIVSEALYLDDPEGNGLEIYWDRPRDTWKYEDGKVKMATLAVDIPDLVAKAKQEPFSVMPAGTTLGHVHLQVDQVEPVEAFYRDAIGLGHSTNYPGATFLGAGGYHHHIGGNIWNSRGRGQPPAGSLGLINFSMQLPTDEARRALLNNLDSLDVAVEMIEGTPQVLDPAGNSVRLTLQPTA